MRGYVIVHEAADKALEGKTNAPALPPILRPATPATTDCGCDLSKPRAVFASPVHGATEGDVSQWLYDRWKGGTDDSCGGLPHDVRPRAICPSGKSFGWKYAITKGFIKIRFDGKGNMMIDDGKVDVDGLVQGWHLIGSSNSTSKEGWKDIKAGEWTPIRKHIWFELRNI